MGPAPAPTVIKIRNGVKSSRINRNEPLAPSGLPVCPDYVSDDVRAVWDYTSSVLDEMQIADPAVRDVLLCYCEAVALHRKASIKLIDAPLTVRGQGGTLIQNPDLRTQRDANADVLRYARELALTPSSRSRVVVGNEKASKSSAERLLS